MGIYLESGFFNFDYVEERGMTFNIILGGRGTGKTYGVTKHIIETQKKFIWLRREQKEADLLKAFPHFTAVEGGENYNTKSLGKNICGVFNGETLVGYIAALRTFAGIRGMNFDDVEEIFFDEFIPEKACRAIKEEGASTLQLAETVMRNRELLGKKPCRMYFLANANDLACPVFVTLGIVNEVARMMKEGKEERLLPDRGLGIWMLRDSPISKKKRETAVYKLAEGGNAKEFVQMAINNIFDYDDTMIASRNLADYKPVVRCGEMVIYKHRSDRIYYVRLGKSGTVRTYGTSDREKEAFRNRYRALWFAYINEKVYFEDFSTLVYFENLFKH